MLNNTIVLKVTVQKVAVMNDHSEDKLNAL